MQEIYCDSLLYWDVRLPPTGELDLYLVKKRWELQHYVVRTSMTDLPSSISCKSADR